MKKRVKDLTKISKALLSKTDKSKLRKIKDKDEKLELTAYLIAAKLKAKFHDLEIDLNKKMKHKKKRDIYIDSRMIALPSKINFLEQKPNEKDFKKIISLFEEVKKEMKNV